MDENTEEISQKRFEALKQFFRNDIKTKNTMIQLAPTELDDMNVESRISYIDSLYKQLEEFEMEFIDTFMGLGLPAIQTVKNYFSKVKSEVVEFNYKNSVREIYKKLIANMNPKLVEEVKKSFAGYKTSSKMNFGNIISQAESINEILHIVHSYITNNEEIMKSMPLIDEKTNDYGYTISLRGERTEEAQSMFAQFPLDLDVGCTDIISMQNRILMMVRDRGHALTIDIGQGEGKNRSIRYFIPKLCNERMIRNLPGINSVTNSGANGMFEVDQEGVFNALFNFIEHVPTDDDIPFLTEIPDEEEQEDQGPKQTTVIENSIKGDSLYEKQRVGLIIEVQKFYESIIKPKEKEEKTIDE